jgi:hypothetical protein
MWPLNRELSLHRLPEVEYQVKAIGYLDGSGCATAGALGAEAVTVSAQHDYFRVFSQPLAKSIRRTCREKIHYFPALQINQDRAERLTLAPCPIVDPHDANYAGQGTTMCCADDLAEQGVPTDRHTKSTHQAMAGTPTQGAAPQPSHLGIGSAFVHKGDQGKPGADR